jgi:tetratricopeptide (TPR) repeat protein
MARYGAWIVGIAGVLVIAGAASVWADDAIDAAVRQALAGAKTNPQRAKYLLNAAKVAGSDAKAQVALASKAVEFGMKSLAVAEARTVTAEALELLLAKDADRAEHWSRQRVELYRRWRQVSRDRGEKAMLGRKLLGFLISFGELCERGGKWTDAMSAYREARPIADFLRSPEKASLTEKYLRANFFARAQKLVEGCRKTLQRDPTKLATRMALIKALVIDLNDPAAAVKFLNADVDETWRSYVSLAAKPAEQLTPPIAKELGDWYRTLSDKAKSYSKANTLARARDYYRQALVANPNNLTVKIALDKVEKALAALGRKPAARSSKDAAARIKLTQPFKPEPLTLVDGGGKWKRVPTGLAGAAVFSGGANAKGGPIVEFEVLVGGVIFIACDYSYQGNPGGGWQAKQWTKKIFAKRGWKHVGQLARGEGAKKQVNEVFAKRVRTGEKYRIRCNKYRPPLLIIRDPSLYKKPAPAS